MAGTVYEIWSARELRYSTSFNGWYARRSFTAAYYNTENDAINAVTQQQGVAINGPHDQNGLLRCQSMRGTQTGFRFWTVNADFVVPPGGNLPNELDPVKQPPKIIWVPGLASEPTDIDADGHPLLNTAGDPITGATREYPSMMLWVTRYQPAFDPRWASMFMGRVNSDNFLVANKTGAINIPPGQARCKIIRPVEEYTVNANFVKVRYEIEFRPDVLSDGDAWQWRFLNVGSNGWYADESVDENGKKVVNYYRDRFYLQNSNDPLDHPVPLDKFGKPIDPNVKVGRGKHDPIPNPGDKGGGNPGWAPINDWCEPSQATGSSALVLNYLRYGTAAFSKMI